MGGMQQIMRNASYATASANNVACVGHNVAVRHAVDARFKGDDQPSILFIDRGGGFYTVNGYITGEYKRALQEHSLQVGRKPCETLTKTPKTL